ncbi:MAG: AraC family transcriptional regulator [Acuticoccus sp.]
MSDPLSEIIALLRPQAPYSKLVDAAGAWRVRRTEAGRVYYAMVLSGRTRMAVGDRPAFTLEAGDFVLVPAAFRFSMSSLDPPPPPALDTLPVATGDGAVRVGAAEGALNAQLLVGYCSFGSPDRDLLVSLLPDMALVRGERRLRDLLHLVREEARADRPARDRVLEHLLQVLLIEALRSTGETDASSGLLRGLADARLGPALRAIHAAPRERWTVAGLARRAGLSRSTFYTRFNRVVGVPPMRYLEGWRMTLARHMLRGRQHSIAEVGAAVGYGSASAFSMAFTRHVGLPPARFARAAVATIVAD